MSVEGVGAQWCFAWFANEAEVDRSGKAILVAKKWAKNAIIGIGFMDGTPAQKALVKRFAPGWTAAGAKLTFSWGPAAQADIRISFAHGGSWSVIGVSCKSVPRSQPTMNLGWLAPGVTDGEAERVILHEFGHALGLIHEHQNPIGSINWNKQAVYRDLSGPPNNWDKDTIDRNVFATYDRQQIQGRTLDPSSIMMYPIPENWVEPPSKPVGLNASLSECDRAFIRLAYP